MELFKSTLLQATLEAGKVLQENFNLAYKINSKTSVNNLVTEIDKKAEKTVIDIIQSQFPSHNILSEEVGEIITDSEIRWIIDPLDGTMNYAHKIPLCSVSIAVEKKGKVILGAILNPFLNELYIAEKGHGAFLNDKKIEVSKTKDIRKVLLATGFPNSRMNISTKPAKVFSHLATHGISVRRVGSAAMSLSWVAAGKLDAFFSYYLEPWDCAAGILLIREAGGKISNFMNQDFSFDSKEIIASNDYIHQSLLDTIHTGENLHF